MRTGQVDDACTDIGVVLARSESEPADRGGPSPRFGVGRPEEIGLLAARFSGCWRVVSAACHSDHHHGCAEGACVPAYAESPCPSVKSHTSPYLVIETSETRHESTPSPHWSRHVAPTSEQTSFQTWTSRTQPKTTSRQADWRSMTHYGSALTRDPRPAPAIRPARPRHPRVCPAGSSLRPASAGGAIPAARSR